MTAHSPLPAIRCLGGRDPRINYPPLSQTCVHRIGNARRVEVSDLLFIAFHQSA
jgi:hypothetical protein